MSREAMKLALDALVFAAYEDIEYDDACDQKVREARNALRQALSQPEQKPIAWMHTTGTGHVYFRKKPQDKVFNPQPVFTAPPKREWVGLNHFDRTLLRTTHAPLKPIYHDKNNSACAEVVSDWDVFFDAVEAKLKERNHG